MEDDVCTASASWRHFQLAPGQRKPTETHNNTHRHRGQLGFTLLLHHYLFHASWPLPPPLLLLKPSPPTYTSQAWPPLICSFSFLLFVLLFLCHLVFSSSFPPVVKLIRVPRKNALASSEWIKRFFAREIIHLATKCVTGLFKSHFQVIT